MSSLNRKLLKFVIPPTLAALLVATGCDRGIEPADARRAATEIPAAAATQPVASNVSIDNFTFTPSTITVPIGTTVTWVNHDDVPHTVTANDKGFGSKAMDTDDRFSHQFTAPGTYPYFCAVHKHMTGQVIVK